MTEWLHTLQAQAVQPPVPARVPFYIQNVEIGSVEPVFMHDLALLANEIMCEQLLKEEQTGWCLLLGQLDATARLNQLAGLLRDTGLSGAWRNEQLAVHSDLGVQIGTIERGAVRPLGIATLAVHLVGQTRWALLGAAAGV